MLPSLPFCSYLMHEFGSIIGVRGCITCKQNENPLPLLTYYFDFSHSKATHDSLENCKGGKSRISRIKESPTFFTLKRQTFVSYLQPINGA